MKPCEHSTSLVLGHVSDEVSSWLIPRVRGLIFLLHQSGLAEDDENVSAALGVLEEVQRELVGVKEQADLARLPPSDARLGCPDETRFVCDSALSASKREPTSGIVGIREP
jgi:hypothetical protein